MTLTEIICLAALLGIVIYAGILLLWTWSSIPPKQKPKPEPEKMEE